MIMWLTGQPGSGKTTLANSIIEILELEKSNIKIIEIALNRNNSGKAKISSEG